MVRPSVSSTVSSKILPGGGGTRRSRTLPAFARPNAAALRATIFRFGRPPECFFAYKKIDSKVPSPSATIPGKVIVPASPCQHPA